MLSQTNGGFRSPWRLRLATSLDAVLALFPATGARADDTPAGQGPPPAGGTLRVPYPEFELLLAPVHAAPGGAGTVRRVEGKGGEARIPPGEYDLLEWHVYAKDGA